MMKSHQVHSHFTFKFAIINFILLHGSHAVLATCHSSDTCYLSSTLIPKYFEILLYMETYLISFAELDTWLSAQRHVQRLCLSPLHPGERAHSQALSSAGETPRRPGWKQESHWQDQPSSHTWRGEREQGHKEEGGMEERGSEHMEQGESECKWKKRRTFQGSKL